MVAISVSYQGELRCEAAHTPSGASLTTDAPLDNHGKGETFSPTDLVATALGSCMLTIMGIAARTLGIPLEGARAEVEKSMVTAPQRRIGSLTVHLHIPTPTTEAQRRALEKAALTCPVHQSLHPEIAIPIEFHWVDA